jgi:hypothetical protein
VPRPQHDVDINDLLVHLERHPLKRRRQEAL